MELSSLSAGNSSFFVLHSSLSVVYFTSLPGFTSRSKEVTASEPS